MNTRYSFWIIRMVFIRMISRRSIVDGGLVAVFVLDEAGEEGADYHADAH